MGICPGRMASMDMDMDATSTDIARKCGLCAPQFKKEAAESAALG